MDRGNEVCEVGHTEVVKLLLAQDGIEVNKARTDDGTTPLFMACQEGHFEVVKLLLAQDGIEANKACTADGSTLLYMACQQGHSEVVKLLLAQDGIEVNKARNDQVTPLYMACFIGHLAVAHVLVLYGADQKVLAYGMTPAHAALSANRSTIVDWLNITAT